jgi:hypothetical protein
MMVGRLSRHLMRLGPRSRIQTSAALHLAPKALYMHSNDHDWALDAADYDKYFTHSGHSSYTRRS